MAFLPQQPRVPHSALCVICTESEIVVPKFVPLSSFNKQETCLHFKIDHSQYILSMCDVYY